MRAMPCQVSGCALEKVNRFVGRSSGWHQWKATSETLLPKIWRTLHVMESFIALLRGINVGGKTLKMEQLRQVCSELGLENPRTYIQSGNVVFASDRSAAHC